MLNRPISYIPRRDYFLSKNIFNITENVILYNDINPLVIPYSAALLKLKHIVGSIYNPSGTVSINIKKYRMGITTNMLVEPMALVSYYNTIFNININNNSMLVGDSILIDVVNVVGINKGLSITLTFSNEEI